MEGATQGVALMVVSHPSTSDSGRDQRYLPMGLDDPTAKCLYPDIYLHELSRSDQ